VRTRGFTLIELMISMALFGLIAAGAMSLVLSGARTQSRSARVDVAQTSLRSAIDFITRDVVGASAGAKSGLFTLASGTVVNAVNLTLNKAGVNGDDWLELYTVDSSTAAQLTSPVGVGANSLPITYEQSSTVATGCVLCGQFLSALPYPAYVQVSDLSSGAIVKLGSVTPTALTLAENMPAAYAANAWVLPSRHVTYKISTTMFGAASTGNAAMLTMDVNGSGFQPLAEGVEDMQIAYGFDNNGDGVINDDNGATAGGDEWLYNAAGETVGTWSIANLRTIRVTLVVKGTSVEGGQQNLPARPKAEDHNGGSVDGFIRRVLRTEIAVRNFNL
jgi:prepilin-type N-terminal cleavage/methylation domain-containing protein